MSESWQLLTVRGVRGGKYGVACVNIHLALSVLSLLY